MESAIYDLVFVICGVVTGIYALKTKREERKIAEALARSREEERHSAEALEHARAENLANTDILAQKDRELSFHRHLFRQIKDNRKRTRIYRKMRRFCSKYPIDRVIYFVCWNGVSDPTHTSAIYVYRQDTHAFDYEYIDIPLDFDYVDRLLDMKRNGYHHIRTADLPPSMIRGHYRREKVDESLWLPGGKIAEDVDGTVEFGYFSLATHGKQPIDDDLREICQVFVQELFVEIMTD